MAGLSPAATEYLLALADDEHLMGQRHAEWIGTGPFLEEDLAFTSIAQDELGHALLLYGLIDDDVDRLAFRRAADEYRCCWLVELPGSDWADALVRHWLYDEAERLRWDNLSASSVPGLADIAARAEREEVYHRRHATALLEPLLASTQEAHDRVAEAIAHLLPLATAVFDPVRSEPEALAEGVAAVESAELADRWRSLVEPTLVNTGVAVDWPDRTAAQQEHRTRRSGHFAQLHADINQVFDLDPTATW